MKIALIHFQPPEYYPPIINICNYLGQELKQAEISLFTNTSDAPAVADIRVNNLFKAFKFRKGDNRVIRIVKAIYFNLFVTLKLFKLRPSTIFYFETSSSFPAFAFLLFHGKKVRLFVHYHEYTSMAQYKKGMLLDRLWHFLEIGYLYKRAYWISQTNKHRQDFFLNEYKFVNPQLLKVLPNFPPSTWVASFEATKIKMKGPPYRIIQLGSISIKHMYARELFDWIKKMDGIFTLDIYSFNTQADIVSYLRELNCPFIKLRGSVAYSEIPKILVNYDIGVVLYKANSENVIYCASNKLFEYLAGDLDVWVSQVMLGSAQYINSASFPKVCYVDFESINDLDWKKLINRDNLRYRNFEYCMEEAYRELIEHFI